MKLNKIITLLFALTLAVLFVSPLQAQYTVKEKSVSPKKMQRLTKKEKKGLIKTIKENPVREARKEARKLKKDDYLVFPGSIPMEKQLERIWMKQYQENPDGSAKYLIADGNGVGKTQTAAELQAMEAAKLQLADKFLTKSTRLLKPKSLTNSLIAKRVIH